MLESILREAGRDAVACGNVGFAVLDAVLDQVTSVEDSLAYARRARAHARALVRFEIGGEGHAMLRRPALWHRLAADVALQTTGLVPERAPLARLWAASGDDAVRVPL